MNRTARAGGDSLGRIVFRSGRRRYALAAADVREVARLPRLTPVPLSPDGLLGLGNVRGETLAVLSPLALDEKASDADPRQLLVLDGVDRIALAVDAVEGVERSAKGKAGKIADLPLRDLIERALPQRVTARRAKGATGAGIASTTGVERLALLRMAIGDRSFALPVEEIEEVLRAPDAITRLPGADHAVMGTVAWRDKTLGILSLAALLGLASSELSPASRIVVASLDGHSLGLLVDRVEGLLRTAPEHIDAVPAFLLRNESEARIRAICRPVDGGRLVSILAAGHLLSEARTRRLLIDSASRPSQTSASTNSLSFLPVRIGPHHIGFPVTAIEQVAARPARCTPVPGAPAWLLGIASVSGKPLAIVDQVRRLTGSPLESARPRLLVVRAGDERLGFLVDEARTIIAATQDAFSPAPLPETLAAGIFGDVLRLNDEQEALLIVEPAALLSSTEQALLAEIAARRAPGHI